MPPRLQWIMSLDERSPERLECEARAKRAEAAYDALASVPEPNAKALFGGIAFLADPETWALTKADVEHYVDRRWFGTALGQLRREGFVAVAGDEIAVEHELIALVTAPAPEHGAAPIRTVPDSAKPPASTRRRDRDAPD